uniref:Uncharacterized protein n=1 Tax=Pithovirus LCPAC302 TaxID=2506593 RepID=A0A481Z828_9VIRU|nr:MAG: uncharacterized protein LCPAC302_02550 [Pithovirus LCPAC302]
MNTYVVGSIGVIGLLYLGYKYGKKTFKRYILDQVLKELDSRMEETDISFHPIKHTRSAMVLFNHGGKQHKICVPYDTSKRRNMLRKKVYLIKGNERLLEITHKPGVPYLLSANDMGGTKIIVEKDGKTVQEYENDTVPKYLD